MTKKKIEPTATKSDLLKAIKLALKFRSKKLQSLISKSQEASEAVYLFEQTNPEYKKLIKARDQASYDRWEVERAERSVITGEYHKLEQLIAVHGPTQKVIDKIEEFINKYECYVD